MMRLFLILFSLTFTYYSNSQSFSYPDISEKGKYTIDFIPSGWKLFDSATGDLNKDGVSDEAIIIQYTDSITMLNEEDDSVLTQPRILLVLFQNPSDSSFYLADQSNSFILCHDNPYRDDPYGEMTINKGILQIEFQLFYNAGSWYITNTSYKFRYKDGQFILIGADYFSIHRASLDYQEYSYNFLTGKRSYTKGNEEKGTKRTTWKSFLVTELKTFQTFKQPFIWQVEEDVYL